MTEERTPYTHGGKRPGAGRKHLDGSNPGEGEKLLKKTITLPRWMVEYLKEIGGGELSRGVRLLVERSKEG